MNYSIFKKETWMWVCGLILAFLLLLLILPLSVGPKNMEGFVLVVDYGNGVEKKFWGSSKMKSTAWDALQQASAHSFITVDVAENFYPASIDFQKNGKDGKNWTLYINNEKISSSPIEVQINSGDKVVWKFE